MHTYLAYNSKSILLTSKTVLSFILDKLFRYDLNAYDVQIQKLCQSKIEINNLVNFITN